FREGGGGTLWKGNQKTHALIHMPPKYSGPNSPAMAPSPTAEATRLVEPSRTSPAAKTPGRLVSRKNGSRSAVQCGEADTSGPVFMKPLGSFSISAGSQLVQGIAPIKVNTA